MKRSKRSLANSERCCDEKRASNVSKPVTKKIVHEVRGKFKGLKLLETLTTEKACERDI